MTDTTDSRMLLRDRGYEVNRTTGEDIRDVYERTSINTGHSLQLRDEPRPQKIVRIPLLSSLPIAATLAFVLPPEKRNGTEQHPRHSPFSDNEFLGQPAHGPIVN